MALLGIALFAALITIVLSLVRDFAFGRWIVDREFEEAMEFASFSAKPHPIYPRRWLLWIGLGLVVAAFIALPISSSFGLVVGLLTGGMIVFFIYDFSGGAVRTNITVLPNGLLFESVRAEQPRLFILYSNIEAVSETARGIDIELFKPKTCNRIPLKCRLKGDFIAKIEGYLHPKSDEQRGEAE
ncbi:hypothetical protein J7L01_00635 [bacterium]|nr:hypothetical protein [bacterium]